MGAYITPIYFIHVLWDLFYWHTPLVVVFFVMPPEVWLSIRPYDIEHLFVPLDIKILCTFLGEFCLSP